MTRERIKEIQEKTAYPESQSVFLALCQVWNECEQEKESYLKQKVSEITDVEFKEGDWAAYNWLDDEGNDNWKIGRIVKTQGKLMYFLDDNTKRCGYMPITTGVKKLLNSK